ncbi:MAG: arsenate reductase family protein, partial [Marinirhabdus sp.]
MKKIYYLSTCDTCKRIMDEIEIPQNFIKKDLRATGLTATEVEEMFTLAGSYEALFSRRAMKYRSMGLADRELSEADYRQLILDEYTFLKRPVIVAGDQIFMGSA